MKIIESDFFMMLLQFRKNQIVQDAENYIYEK